MESLKNDIQVLREIASDDLSFYSEDSGDVDTVTPSVVRDGRVEESSKEHVQEAFEPLNESSIQTSENDESHHDDYSNGSYNHDDEETACQYTHPYSSTLTTSFEGASNDEDDDNDENIVDPETESSVDMLCNHAARLVASMPTKK
jgi:hypothetical protein